MTIARYDVRGYPPEVPERECEVRMDNGTWEPGIVKQDTTTVHGHAALIEWRGITAWLYREQGPGHPAEWRYP